MQPKNDKIYLKSTFYIYGDNSHVRNYPGDGASYCTVNFCIFALSILLLSSHVINFYILNQNVHSTHKKRFN